MEPLSVVCVGMMIGVLVFIIGKIYYYYYFEYRADEYSALNYSRDAMIDSLRRLDEISGGTLTKGNYNHPKLRQRLNNLKS